MRSSTNAETPQQPELTSDDSLRFSREASKYGQKVHGDQCPGSVYHAFRDGAKYATLHERAAARWKSIAKYGLPGEAQYGKWIELLKFLPHSSVGPIIFFRQWYEGIDAPDIETLRRIYTHWRELELPTQS